ncbi:putative disease resistance RPP13-like protein 1 [Pistacia vera]|uniref:putative disease resistance RPP13-like protein 1 n=1 Tax=Pistacia vera TaxID=55513 RepID=UPI001262FC84|nr:putative disease resistance RPP13-like protein 1 [Pistacia vera]XP_031259732.1 putative disease resistance RPP13-like protein 1 [Pistacia vera]
MPVGELFLSAFLSVLFDRLASKELLNFASQEGVSSKLKKWEKTFRMIEKVLGDAEEKQLTENDGAVKIWLDDLRDLAYDVEDILDEFATENLRRKVMCEDHASTSKIGSFISACCTSLTPSSVKFNISMGSKINGITTRLAELCKQKIDLGLKEISVGTSTAVRTGTRPASTCVRIEPAVYGRDDDKAKILELVSRDEPSQANFNVIPIVGLGGIGKTTLAREVYNDKAVEGFSPRVWTCVSDVFDVLGISKAILESITSTPCSLTSLNEVQVQLKNSVTGKKFLLVLDDVWNEDYELWEALKSPFMAGAAESKIIVTTRSRKVALTMEQGVCFDLKLLEGDDCWSIFEKHVYGNRVIATSQNLKFIREKVVEKCKGLPLAAKTLGGLLRTKQIYGEWEDILNSKIWELPQNGILSALRLSYHYLPSHLKRCFAYCAILPKDYEFTEKELVLLWMAEGLIQQPRNKQLEYVGGEYFRDLLSRSFFQESNSEDYKFVMHDLINDLARWVSRETSFRLEEEFNVTETKRFERTIRHASYTYRAYEVKKNFEVFHTMAHLRTFIRMFPPLRYAEQTYISRETFFHLLPKLKNLRALCLTNYHAMKLPDSIGDLKLLRYLNLSKTEITYLPESTSSLFNLQSLLLRGCSHLKKLPLQLGDLVNLRHLDIRGAILIREIPSGMKKLKCIRTLSNFVVGEGVVSSLKDLKELKFIRGELYISRLENATDCHETRDSILCDKKDLEVLVLEWSSSHASRDEEVEKIVLDILRPHTNLKELTIKNFCGKIFSSWIGDPTFSNMVSLKLDGCKSCKTLPSIGLLGLLKNLTIKGMKMLKKIGCEVYGESCSESFKSLETLCFENLPEWEHWDPFEEKEHVERFSCLKQLSISQCPKLSGGLPNRLLSLEKLVIRDCEQLVVSFTSLPMLCHLEIERCKGMVCSSSSESLISEESNVPGFRSWTREGFQKLETLKIVGWEELTHLWGNEIFLEKPLQGSQSFTSLKELCMRELPNLALFPDGLLSIPTKVEIRECDAITSLHGGLKHNNPRVEHLEVYVCNSLSFIVRGQLPSSLKTLWISECEKLVCIWEDTGTSSPSSSYALMHKEDVDNTPTSLLCELRISGCLSLTHLSSTYQLPPTLTNLSIWNCTNLRTLLSGGQSPKAESIVESFDNYKSLGSTLEGQYTLRNLKNIFIWECSSLVLGREIVLSNNISEVCFSGCEKIQALPSCMHTVKSVGHLTISKCPSMALFPEEDIPDNIRSLNVGEPKIYNSLAGWGFHKFTSLTSLSISRCPNAVSFPEEEMGMKLPSSLKNLTVDGFPKLKHLFPMGFQDLISLERLWIKDCPNLTSLLDFPSSLLELGINSCQNLTSLPDLPSSLLELYVINCPLLKQRCKRDKGQEWPKIKHIPLVMID